MSQSEIVKFFNVIDNLRDRTIFETIYGSGMRISEIVKLRVQNIDSKQMRIYIQKGKGNKDRYTLLSQRNLDLLRQYWKQYRPNHPQGYLFYARSKNKHTLTTRSITNAFSKYRTRANFPNTYTSHTLRHCFATHLLEAGVDVYLIKELLGHSYIQTTSFYLHLQNAQGNVKSPLDILPENEIKDNA
jgi:site-specific recombinase XerD